MERGGLHLSFITLTISMGDHIDLTRKLTSQIEILKVVRIQKPLR